MDIKETPNSIETHNTKQTAHYFEARLLMPSK